MRRRRVGVKRENRGEKKTRGKKRDANELAAFRCATAAARKLKKNLERKIFCLFFSFFLQPARAQTIKTDLGLLSSDRIASCDERGKRRVNARVEKKEKTKPDVKRKNVEKILEEVKNEKSDFFFLFFSSFAHKPRQKKKREKDKAKKERGLLNSSFFSAFKKKKESKAAPTEHSFFSSNPSKWRPKECRAFSRSSTGFSRRRRRSATSREET